MTPREFLSAMEAAGPYLTDAQRASIWSDVGRLLAQPDAVARSRAAWDERKRASRAEEETLTLHTAELSRRIREPA